MRSAERRVVKNECRGSSKFHRGNILRQVPGCVKPGNCEKGNREKGPGR